MKGHTDSGNEKSSTDETGETGHALETFIVMTCMRCDLRRLTRQEKGVRVYTEDDFWLTEDGRSLCGPYKSSKSKQPTAGERQKAW